MAELVMREILPHDIDNIARNMRKADLSEMHAAGFVDPDRVLRSLVAQSAYSRVAIVDGEAVMMFGVQAKSMLSRDGLVWAVAADNALPRHRRLFLEHSPRYVKAMLRLFPKLTNHVHAPNRTAVRWLQFMGFRLGEPERHPYTGEMFRPFELEAS